MLVRGPSGRPVALILTTKNHMKQNSISYDDAVDRLLEFLETDERFNYITYMRTKVIKLKVPDWSGQDFEEAKAMLVVDIMPYLYRSLPFDPWGILQKTIILICGMVWQSNY